jgi:hypothetical protein
MHDYDIFREELSITCPSHGYALWDPDPGIHGPVEVGDVGFIREGRFFRLFNALLPEDHPSHMYWGVPEYHEPLILPISPHEDRCVENTWHFCSRHVAKASRGPRDELGLCLRVINPPTITNSYCLHLIRPTDDMQVTFSCHGKQGAMLFLPFPARRTNTVAQGYFGRWIIRHIDMWFLFSQRLGLGINGMEDIILVTGCHRARSWISATFRESQRGCRVSFGVRTSGDSGVHLNWMDARGGTLKLGPSGEVCLCLIYAFKPILRDFLD